MYDELVTQCRDCIECLCGDCKYEHLQKPGNFVPCMNALLGEAADAIEELLTERDEVNADSWKTAFEIERDEHRWIPVTERLPKEYVNVLCYYEYYRYGEYNCMFRTIDRGYYGDGIWGGEAGQGHKNKVLAWMPLPEPPKEELA